MSGIKTSRDASLTFFFIAFVLFLTSFSSMYWVETPLGNGGLWKECKLGFSCYSTTKWRYIKSSQALMIMAFIFATVSFIQYCVWASVSRATLEKGPTANGVSAVVFQIITGVFNVSGVAVFGAMYVKETPTGEAEDLSWSWFCGVFSSALFFLNGLITLGVIACQTGDIQQQATPRAASQPRPPALTTAMITQHNQRHDDPMHNPPVYQTVTEYPPQDPPRYSNLDEGFQQPQPWLNYQPPPPSDPHPPFTGFI